MATENRINVLAAMDNLLLQETHRNRRESLRDCRAAVAELIEAGKAVSELASNYADLCDDPDGHAETDAKRFRAALAKVSP